MDAQNKNESAGNSKLKFSTLLQAGKTATGIKIPDEIIKNMGAGKKPPVPEELQKILNKNATMKKSFDTLSNSKKTTDPPHHRCKN